jgi:hypothetical protein
MKKKIFTFLFAASFISISSFSQTVKDNIDKAAKDKSTTDRSARADVLIHKKTISDNSVKTTKTTQKVTLSATTVKTTKYKKNKYKKKHKHS